MIKSQTQPNTLVNRSPFYYGWIVWAVATIGIIGTSPGQSFTVSLFVDHFIADFNLDRTTVSGLYGLGTFLGALGLTWIGRGVDRHGNRAAGAIVSGLFALALVGMALITGPLMLLMGFIAIRALGAGALGLSSSTTIAQWFRSYRGRMISLMTVVFMLFQTVYVPWLQQLLETVDWRLVWLILSAAVGLIVLPVTWGLIRNRPEDFGLSPDGKKLSPEEFEREQYELQHEDNYTLQEATRTPIFWVFALGRMMGPAWVTALVFHQVSLFQSLGHEASAAAQTYSLIALFAAGVAIGFGVLVDRFRPAVPLGIELGALMLALFMAMVMTEAWMLVVYALAVGIMMGSGGIFDGAVWPNLFGRQNQGAIRGFVASLLVAGSAGGPILLGLSYDHLGGYSPMLWVGILLCAVLLVLTFLVKEPQKRAAVSLSEQQPGGEQPE
jgi:MFS family permease